MTCISKRAGPRNIRVRRFVKLNMQDFKVSRSALNTLSIKSPLIITMKKKDLSYSIQISFRKKKGRPKRRRNLVSITMF